MTQPTTTSPAPRALYAVVNSSEHNAPNKYGFSKYRTQFVLKDCLVNPNELLGQVMRQLIDEALQKNRDSERPSSCMGITVSSDCGSGQLVIPFRAPDENNADKILRELEACDFPELFGTMFTIEITTIQRPPNTV